MLLLNETYQDLADGFYLELQYKGYAAKSNRGSRGMLSEFLKWLQSQSKEQIQDVRAVDIINYYQYIGKRPNRSGTAVLSRGTCRVHMRTLKNFFEWLLLKSVIASNPCSSLYFAYPRQPTAQRQVLTGEEITQLYQWAETALERAILSLAYGCGLRADEIEKCNTPDIRFQEKILIVPRGKGTKKRVVPISKGVAKDLMDYYHQDRQQLKDRSGYSQSETAFMLNSKGRRMRKWSCNKHLKALIERTGNPSLIQKQITLHNLRHSIATHLIEQGVKVEQVRLFLGHSQLETTQIYTHISNKQLKQLTDND